MTAGMYGWILESTPASTTLPPAQALTAAQTLANAQFPPWNSPSVAYQPPNPGIAGSMVQPYIYPVPPTAAPTPPQGVVAPARGPNPFAQGPTGPYGPGIGGMGKPALTTTKLPSGTHAVVYPSVTLTAQGGVGPYTFTAAPLPAGLTLTAGVISGTPTTAGTTNVVVTATDANGNVGAATTLPLVIA